MDFNRDEFVKDALQQGYSAQEINTYLLAKGQKPISKWEGAVEKGTPSKVGAGIGGVGGFALAGPPGAAAGGALGYGVGNLLEDITKLKNGTYEKPANVKEAVGQTMGNLSDMSGAGMVTGGLGMLPYVLKTMLSPLETLKKTSMSTRNIAIGDKSLPYDKTRQDILLKLASNKKYLMSPPEVQQMADKRMRTFFENVNPIETVNSQNGVAMGKSMISQPENVNIRKIYEYLPAFEDAGRAYSKSGEPGAAALSQGTNLASHELRNYLNSQIGPIARGANQVYSATSKIQPGAKKATLGVAGSAVLFYLVKKLMNQIGSK
jgi:hypothetical protein